MTRMASPTVGQRAKRSLTLSNKHVETFAELTGDYNPLHFDTDFASRTRFGALVVQGGLTTGISFHATKPVTELRCVVTRQTGETVLEGEGWCYTMAPNGA